MRTSVFQHHTGTVCYTGTLCCIGTIVVSFVSSMLHSIIYSAELETAVSVIIWQYSNILNNNMDPRVLFVKYSKIPTTSFN